MIVVFSPRFRRSSNGTRVLYELAKNLAVLGAEPAIVNSNEGPEDEVPVEYRALPRLDPEGLRIGERDVVIYPERESGNPLRAKRVVRYMLNRPYFCGGDGIRYGETDYLVGFSRTIDRSLPELFLLVDESETFETHRKTPKGDGAAVYFGKVDLEVVRKRFGELKRLLGGYRSWEIITRRYPSREEAFAALAKARALFSFDPVSNLNYEATLLGTPVFLMDDSFHVIDGETRLPMHGVTNRAEDLDAASAEVWKAFEAYKEAIAGGLDATRDFLSGMTSHFGRIFDEGDEAYAAEVRAANGAREADDLRVFDEERHMSKLTNIDQPTDLPRAVRRDRLIREKIGRRRNEFLRKRYGKAWRVKSLLSDLRLLPALRRIRARIRGGKGPGDPREGRGG